MKNRWNRWIAMLLVAVFMLQPCLAVAEALYGAEEIGFDLYFDDENGVFVWEGHGETITENVYISRYGIVIGGQKLVYQDILGDLYVRGVVRFAEGAALHIAGLNLTLEVGARFYGDIYTQSVDEDVYIMKENWQEDFGGNHVHVEVAGSLYGMLSTGVITKKYAEASDAERRGDIPWPMTGLDIKESGYVETLRIDGGNNLGCRGHIGTMVMGYTQGEAYTQYVEGMLNIGPGAYVERIVDDMSVPRDSGVVITGARVDEIESHNFNIWSEQGASFGKVVLDREMEEAAIYGRFSQCDIESLTIVGTDVLLTGGCQVGELTLKDGYIHQNSVIHYWWHGVPYDDQNDDYLADFDPETKTEASSIGKLYMENSSADLMGEVRFLRAKNSDFNMRGQAETIVLEDSQIYMGRDYTILDEYDSNMKRSLASADHLYEDEDSLAGMVYVLNGDIHVEGAVDGMAVQGETYMVLSDRADVDLMYRQGGAILEVADENGVAPEVQINAMILDAHNLEAYGITEKVRIGAMTMLNQPEYVNLRAEIGTLYLTEGQEASMMPDVSIGQVIDAPETKEGAAVGETLTEGSYTVRKTSSEDQWFSVELQEYDTLKVTLTAKDGLGALLMDLPDEYSHYCWSAGEAAVNECITTESGKAHFRLVGGAGEYEIAVDIEQAARVDYSITEHMAVYQQAGSGQATEYAEYDLMVSNITAPDEEMWFVRREDVIIVPAAYVAKGDEISIRAISLREGWADGEAVVSLDSEKKASAAIASLEQAYYTVTCLDDSDVRIYLYRADGSYCATMAYENGQYHSGYLEEGEYSAVMIRGSAGMWRFTKLEDFAAFGLTQGEDYRLDSFEAQNGRIAHYPNATVPDAPELAEEFFDMSKTSFRTNTGSCAEGEMMLMSMSYGLSEAYAAADGITLSLEFSDNLSMVEGSLLVNGEITAFEQVDSRVTLELPGTSGELTWYAQCTTGTEAFALATIAIHMPEGDVNACLGAASAQVCKLSFHVPDITSGEFNMFGKGPAGALIVIYDGEERIAAATCNEAGYWSVTYDFGKAQYYLAHELKAEIASGSSTGACARETVVHYDNAPDVAHFTMYYNEHQYIKKIEISGEDFGKNVVSFSYDPYKPFSFAVKMDGNDQIEQLFITGSVGAQTRMIEAKYDEATGEWIASGFFDPENLDYIAESIGVAYIEKMMQLEPIEIDSAALAAEAASLGNKLREMAWLEMSNEVFYGQEAEEGELLENVEEITLYESDLNVGFAEGSFAETYRVRVCASMDPDSTHVISVDDNVITLYLPIETDIGMLIGSNAMNAGRLITTSSFADDVEQNTSDINEIIEEFRELLEVKDSDLLDNISEFIDDLTLIDDSMQINTLNKKLNGIISAANSGASNAMVCKECEAFLYAYLGVADQANEMIRELQGIVWETYRGVVTDLAFKALKALKWGEKINIDPNSKLGKYLDKYIHLDKLPEFLNEQLDDILDNLQEQLDNLNPDIGERLDAMNAKADHLWQNLYDLNEGLAKCIKENCKPKPKDDPNPVDPGIDPSGYVFEAVESNRIEGVTTVCYYQNEAGDMVFWDAYKYGQKNPLTTNSEGYYEWFVPVGQWKVTYEKEGYEYTESEWLPVPPPQTEVNQAMVSYEPPFIEEFSFYGDSCLITFSRYVRVESVTPDTIDIGEIAFEAEAVNAEALYDGSGMGATSFRLNFNEPVQGDSLTLRVTPGVVSYADVPANENELTALLSCKVEDIELPDAVNVMQGQSIELTGRIIAGAGVETVEVAAASAMDELCAVAHVSQVSADGTFTLTIEARRASSVDVYVNVPGSMASAQIQINTLNVEPIDPVIPEGDYMQIVLPTREDTIPLYYEANETSGMIFDDLMDGFMVRSIGMSADGLWHQVEYMGRTGWLPVGMLESVDIADAIGRIADDAMRVSTQNSRNINLWSAPSKDESMEKVQVGDTVTVLCAIDGTEWYYACKDGAYGYVNGRYLK